MVGYTTALRLAKPAAGGSTDTWGTELNGGLIDMLDEAIGGVVSISVTAGNVTLSTANGSTDQARNALIILTGTPGTTRTVTFPNVEKLTWVKNTSDSTATLTAGAGTTASLPAGARVLVYTDAATNLVSLSPQYDEGTFTPTLGDGTNNYTLSTALGSYTRNGDTVTAHVTAIWTSIGSAGAGQLRVGAMPVTSNATANYRFSAVIGEFSGLDTTATLNQITAVMLNSATTVSLSRANDNAGPTALPANGSSATGYLFLSITYKA